MQTNWYYKGLVIISILLFLLDLMYGIMGSSTSLIRSAGHLAFIIILLRKHSELKFSIALWSWVMLVILPAIYPVISTLFLVSGNIEGIDFSKLIKDLIWILIGINILVLNRKNKFI